MDKDVKKDKSAKKVARLYRRKGSRVKEELSFSVPKKTKLV